MACDSSLALIVVTLGPSHRLAYQNRSVQAMFGVRPLGVRLEEAFPELVTVGCRTAGQGPRDGAIVDVPARAVSVRDIAGGQVCLATCSRRWARRPSAWSSPPST